MAKTKEKMWCVFGTHMGYFVSVKKMTEAEINTADVSYRIDIDCKEIGGHYGSNFITSCTYCPQWTRKEAQQYADEQNRRTAEMYKVLHHFEEDKI